MKGYSTEVIDILVKARRDSSNKQYEYQLKLWAKFCSENTVNMFTATVGQGLLFLQQLWAKGLSYSTINSARSALSLILHCSGSSFGEHPDVCKFMKGIANLNPPKHRYVDIWDPEVVLKTLRSWSPAQSLSFHMLSLKTVMLVLLVTGKRPQIITKLHTDNMSITKNSYKFILEDTDLKEGRRGYKPDRVELRKYPADKRICIYHYITAYLHRSLEFRGKEKLVFITSVKPFKKVSQDTVSRWIKSVLNHSGIDTTVFTAGSVRSASTSKAKRQGAPVEEVLRAGGWSRVTTFTEFYDRPVRTPGSFAEKVLQ